MTETHKPPYRNPGGTYVLYLMLTGGDLVFGSLESNQRVLRATSHDGQMRGTSGYSCVIRFSISHSLTKTRSPAGYRIFGDGSVLPANRLVDQAGKATLPRDKRRNRVQQICCRRNLPRVPVRDRHRAGREDRNRQRAKGWGDLKSITYSGSAKDVAFQQCGANAADMLCRGTHDPMRPITNYVRVIDLTAPASRHTGATNNPSGGGATTPMPGTFFHRSRRSRRTSRSRGPTPSSSTSRRGAS